jgi:hypothetical protein
MDGVDMYSDDEIEAISPIEEMAESSRAAQVQQNIAAADAYAAAETQNEINAQVSFEQILTGQATANATTEANSATNDAQFMGVDEEEPMPPATASPTQQYHDIGMAAMEAVDSAPSAAQVAANQTIANTAANNQVDVQPVIQQPQDDPMGESPAIAAARGTLLYQSGAFLNGAVGGGVAVHGVKGPSTGGSDPEAGTLPDEVVPDVDAVEPIPAVGAVGSSTPVTSIVTDRFSEHLERRPPEH